MLTTTKEACFPPEIIACILKYKYNSSINERADLAARLMYWNPVIISFKIRKKGTKRATICHHA